MRPLFPSVRFFALFLTCGAAYGQSGPVPLAPWRPIGQAYFQGGVTMLGSAAVGNLTEDHVLDLALMRDDEAVVMYGPSEHSGGFPVADPAASVTVLPSQTPGELDTVVVGTWRGLELYDKSPYGPMVLTTTIAGATGDVLGSSPEMHVGDFDGNAIPDIAALRADRLGIAIVYDAGTPSQSIATPITSQVQIHTFRPIDFSGDARHEVAIVAQGITAVIDTNMNVLATILFGSSSDFLGVLDRAGDTHQRLLHLVFLAGPDTYHAIVGDASGFEAAVSFGAQPFRGMTIADADLDGNDDAILGSRGTGEMTILFQQSSAPSFGPSLVEVLDVCASSTPDTLVLPICADLDRDGDNDFVGMLPAEGRMEVALSEVVPAPAWIPELFGGEVEVVMNSEDPENDTTTFLFDVRLGATPPAELTQLQVVLWDAAGENFTVESTAIANAIFTHYGATEFGVSLTVPGAFVLETIYHAQVRLVHWDVQDEDFHFVSPSSLWRTRSTLLGTNGTTTSPIDIVALPEGSWPTGESGVVTSEEPDLPCFADEDPPPPPDPRRPDDPTDSGGTSGSTEP